MRGGGGGGGRGSVGRGGRRGNGENGLERCCYHLELGVRCNLCVCCDEGFASGRVASDESAQSVNSVIECVTVDETASMEGHNLVLDFLSSSKKSPTYLFLMSRFLNGRD